MTNKKNESPPPIAEMLDKCIHKLNELIDLEVIEMEHLQKMTLLDKAIASLIAMDRNNRNLEDLVKKSIHNLSDEEVFAKSVKMKGGK